MNLERACFKSESVGFEGVSRENSLFLLSWIPTDEKKKKRKKKEKKKKKCELIVFISKKKKKKKTCVFR